MNKATILFDDGTHKCIMFSVDDEEVHGSFLSVNQFLIIQGEHAVLIDPGSEIAYPEVYELVSEYIAPENIKYIFFSHQDPDVAGSIAQWSISTPAQFIISKLWIRFMTHYGVLDMSRMVPLEDGGSKISFGDHFLQFIPAHFLHSPGNFSVYDSCSKILFSGDIGAAPTPLSHGYKSIDDFETHITYMEDFHKRYMHSNLVAKRWVERVKGLDLRIMAPQHGAIFKDNQVWQFLTWFSALPCGSDILE